MIKYAELDINDTVVNIIISTESQILLMPGVFIKYGTEDTSSLGEAIISGTYDRAKNKFISPKPWPSWILNDSDEWESPVERPEIGTPYSWDENSQTWNRLEQIDIDI
jgi:hypothetical protein